MKKLFKKVFRKIKRAFSKVRRYLDKHGADILELTNIIREAVDSPKADFIVMLTESKIDDNLLKLLRTAFSKVVPTHIPEGASKEDAYNAYISGLRELPSKQIQNATVAKIGSQLLRLNSPDKLKESDADTIVQLAYYQTKI